MSTGSPGLTDAQIAAIGGLAQTLQSDPNFIAALQGATLGPGARAGEFVVPRIDLHEVVVLDLET